MRKEEKNRHSKNTDVTNHLYENSDHKIDFAKPKILGTARNRTKLFILETLSIDKLKPDINVDQSLITVCLFNTWLFFFLFSHSVRSASITGILSVLSSGTVACLHQQVLLNCSAILQLVRKCVYFHSRLVLNIFYCFRFYFLQMMDIAKSQTSKNFTILNKALLFLIKLNKTAVQSVPK